MIDLLGGNMEYLVDKKIKGIEIIFWHRMVG